MDVLEEHIIYFNYGIRILIFLIVLFFGIRYRNRLVIIMAVSYCLSLTLVVVDAPRLFSLLAGTLSATLTAWFVINAIQRGVK